MSDLLMEPVKYFEQEGRGEFDQNAHQYFDELVAKSGIDVDANRATVREYNAENEIIKTLDKRMSRFKTLRVFLIIGIVICLIVFAASFGQFEEKVWVGILMLVLGLGLAGGGIYLWFWKINPILKDANAEKEKHVEKANELLAEAQAQMAPLNALFDNTDTFKLIEKTIPELSFDRSFNREHEDKFLNHFGFVDIVDGEMSIADTLSGRMCQNPFLFFRYKQHVMGTETYTGSLVITWTETYRDSDGDIRTRTRTQTLTASVEKPKPYYHMETALGYGCQAAPDLNFSRDAAHTEKLSDKEIAKKVRSGEKELQKQARKATKEGGSFQEMANSEFDVLFGANDRDQEVQFRLMFTPLAQRNTVALLKDLNGWGDDFNFVKRGRYNLIESEHAQDWDMDTGATNYWSYDVDQAREKFTTRNNAYFKSIFFDFAPLMSIPAYMEEPSFSMEPMEYGSNYTYYEHEAMANALGQDAFAHEDAHTESILKTQFQGKQGNSDIVSVTAYAYTTEERIDYVPVKGGDGYYHQVPVPWIEYIPVEKTSNMAVQALGITEREFRANPDITANLTTDWAYFHEMISYLC
ncbi:MAG: hypothetical protein IJF42_02745 [Clostridia bacterium]|nr:hypothetical protein [Clostridia bacterium]